MPYPSCCKSTSRGSTGPNPTLTGLMTRLRSLKEKEEIFQTQLASIPTESKDQDRTLLKELKAKLLQLESRYSDKYPDVKKTRMDVDALEKRISRAVG